MSDDLMIPQDLDYLGQLPPEATEKGRLKHEELALSRARLRVVKSTSRVAKQGLATPGEIWSDLHETTLGKCEARGEKITWTEPIIVTPVLFAWEWLFFSEGDELKIEYRTDSPSDPRVKELGDQEFKNRFLNIGLIVDDKPFVMTTSGYDNDAGKQFYRACISPKMVNGSWINPPIQSRIFKLTTEWNAKSEHPGPVFTFAGLHNAEGYVKVCTIGRDLHGLKSITAAEEVAEHRAAASIAADDDPFSSSDAPAW